MFIVAIVGLVVCWLIFRRRNNAPPQRVRRPPPTRRAAVRKRAATSTAATAAAAASSVSKSSRDSPANTETEEPFEEKKAAEKPRKGILHKGTVVWSGIATCVNNQNKKYKSFLVRLVDHDGTESELKGVDLQQLIDEGKLKTGQYVEILSSRRYTMSDSGRKTWKNHFEILQPELA